MFNSDRETSDPRHQTSDRKAYRRANAKNRGRRVRLWGKTYPIFENWGAPTGRYEAD